MKRYKVGYTTGVFDLFHIGHLNILKKAKEHCEYLIVGVSTDELVIGYKNKTPVIKYEERSEIVRSCKYVDIVIPQENRDKLEAFSKLQFDVMFVGDDWKNDPMFVEVEKKLKENNVEVIYFPYTQDTSSTLLKSVLKKINSNEE